MKFFSSLKIGPKIILSVFVFVVVLVSIIIYTSSDQIMSLVKKETSVTVKGAVASLVADIESLKLQSSLVANAIAMSEPVRKAMKDKNRNELKKALNDLKVFSSEFTTIVDEKGDVVLRTHEPDKFGDNIKNQKNISTALGGAAGTFVEPGTAVKLSARTGAPIFDENKKVIGVVSTGYRLDNPKILETLKSINLCDYSVCLGDTRISTTLKDEQGKYKIDTKIDPVVADRVLNKGEQFQGEANVVGVTFIGEYLPIKDEQGKPFGVITSAKSLEVVQKEKNDILMIILAVAIVVFVVMTFSMIFVIRKIVTKPLGDVLAISQKIARGDLNV